MLIFEETLYYQIIALHCSDTAFIFSKGLCQRLVRDINIYYFSNFVDANERDKDGTMEMT